MNHQPTDPIEQVSAFNLRILWEVCDSDPDNDVAGSVMMGLMMLNKLEMAEELIADLTGINELNELNDQHRRQLPPPMEMAVQKPRETLTLGEIFAEALKEAAETMPSTGAGAVYRDVLPYDCKSTILSATFERLEAPELARLFMPVLS